jgi:hypothetical protein
MENVINGTPKATFYLNELASDIAEFVIEEKYSGTGAEILIERDGVMVYDDNIQEEYDLVYDKVFHYLQINQIK